nr:hypothetical protein CFP56_62491 [Quercus suber]
MRYAGRSISRGEQLRCNNCQHGILNTVTNSTSQLRFLRSKRCSQGGKSPTLQTSVRCSETACLIISLVFDHRPSTTTNRISPYPLCSLEDVSRRICQRLLLLVTSVVKTSCNETMEP